MAEPRASHVVPMPSEGHPPRYLRVFMAAQALSLAGSALTGIAVTYLLTTRSGVATAGLVQGLPMILALALAPWAGGLVDRKDPRGVLLKTAGVIGVVTCLLVLYGPAWYLLVFCLRTPLETVFSAALVRLLPSLATPATLQRTAGMFSLTGRLATAAGLAVGPLLTVWLGTWVFLLDAATFVVVAAVVWWLPHTPIEATTTRGMKAQLREVGDYIRGHRSVALIAGLYVVAGLAWAVKDVLFIQYVVEQLMLDPARWAGIYAAVALGGEAVAAALIAAGRIPGGRRAPLMVVIAFTALAVSLLLTAFTTSASWAFVWKAMEGAATNVVGVLAVTAVAYEAPESLRGRMKAFLSMANKAALSGGKLGVGAAAGAGGVQLVYAGVGVVMLGGLLVGGVFGRGARSRR